MKYHSFTEFSKKFFPPNNASRDINMVHSIIKINLRLSKLINRRKELVLAKFGTALHRPMETSVQIAFKLELYKYIFPTWYFRNNGIPLVTRHQDSLVHLRS